MCRRSSRRTKCTRSSSHHGSNLIKALQEFNDLRLVGRLHSGKAASLSHGALLVVGREVIKLTASEGFTSDILVLTEDANTTADGHRCPLVVTFGGKKKKIISALLVPLQREFLV